MDLLLSSGSNSLIVGVDQLTKFVSLLLCAFGPNHPLGGVADLLVHHNICRCSVLRSIVHDQDAQFSADPW